MQSLRAETEAACNDMALLERTRRGDARAFAVLAKRHWEPVHRIAWHMLPDGAAAAGVAEAAFLAVLHAGEDFPEDALFKTSLYRVVMGESWRRLGPAAGGAIPSAERSVAARIRQMLLSFEALDRAAFLLVEVGELSSGDAAAVLGITPASVRRRTHHVILGLMGPVGGGGTVSMMQRPGQ